MQNREHTELDRTVHSQKHVVAFDVSMDDLISVQKLQCLQTLRDNRQEEVH